MFSNKQRIADKIARTFVNKLNTSKFNYMSEILSLVEPAKNTILKNDLMNLEDCLILVGNLKDL